MFARTAIRRFVVSGAVGLLTSLSLTAQSVPAQATTAQLVTIGPGHGTFYANPSNTGGFVAPTVPALFSQDFPVIAFNPPSAQCSNPIGVNTSTRPFTDVVSNPDGTCSTIVAQGGLPGSVVQAGVLNPNGVDLTAFEAVFTANLTVPAAGSVTFSVIADDGWVLAAGPSAPGSQPTYVSGSREPAPLPTAGFVTGFPVVGAFNQGTLPVARTVTVNFPTAGVYPIELDYSECCGGPLSLVLTAGPIVPTSHATRLTYTGPSTQDFNDPATLTARLLDSSVTPGAPLPNQTVSFNLGGQTCSGVTDPGGNAACTLTPNEAAGTFSLNATFSPGAGSPLLGSIAATTFVVTKEEAATQYTGPTLIANTRGATLSAALKEDSATPIASRMVTLTHGAGTGAQSCVGTTDGFGNASCTIPVVNQSLGPGSVSASFSGDGFYLPSVASSSTLVFQFLASGAFVIGDKSASVSASANFWGAQWSTLNALSGGLAPASFKGFAETTSPAGCGAGWSTDTGNSSGPPASVPSFMAVLVARTVSQSGSIVSGDTPEIVIVQTAPGYAPDPGIPATGTGTVVAVFCH